MKYLKSAAWPQRVDWLTDLPLLLKPEQGGGGGGDGRRGVKRGGMDEEVRINIIKK